MPAFEVEFKQTPLTDWESYQKSFHEFKCEVENLLNTKICPKLYQRPLVSSYMRGQVYILKIRTCCYEHSKEIAKLLHDHNLR